MNTLKCLLDIGFVICSEFIAFHFSNVLNFNLLPSPPSQFAPVEALISRFPRSKCGIVLTQIAFCFAIKLKWCTNLGYSSE